MKAYNGQEPTISVPGVAGSTTNIAKEKEMSKGLRPCDLFSMGFKQFTGTTDYFIDVNGTVYTTRRGGQFLRPYYDGDRLLVRINHASGSSRRSLLREVVIQFTDWNPNMNDRISLKKDNADYHPRNLQINRSKNPRSKQLRLERSEERLDFWNINDTALYCG
jgi:hypothetical protein